MVLEIKNENEFHTKIKDLTQIQTGDRLLKTDLNFKKKDGRVYHWLKVIFSFLPGDRFSKTRIYNVAAAIEDFYKDHQKWFYADDKRDINFVLTYLEKVADKSKNKKLKIRNKNAIQKARNLIFSQTQSEVKNPIPENISDPKNQDKEHQESHLNEPEKDSQNANDVQKTEIMGDKTLPEAAIRLDAGKYLKQTLDSVNDKVAFLTNLDEEQFIQLAKEIKSEKNDKVYDFLQELSNLKIEDRQMILLHQTFINVGEKLDPISFIKSLRAADDYWEVVFNNFSQVRINLFAADILTICKSQGPDGSKSFEIVRLLNNLLYWEGSQSERGSIARLLACGCDIEDIPLIMESFLAQKGDKQKLGAGFIYEIMRKGDPDAIRLCLSKYWSNQEQFERLCLAKKYWSNQNQFEMNNHSLLALILANTNTAEKLDILLQTLKSANIYPDNEIVKMLTREIGTNNFGPSPTFKVSLGDEVVISMLEKNNIYI